MSITDIISKAFLSRQRELESYAFNAERMQREQLESLVDRAKNTEYGRKHIFASIKSYEDFQANIPLNIYDSLKDDIDRMRHGEPNVLWPGQVKWYAKSSGTTNDKSKFIPVSSDGLTHMHYKGGRDAIILYLMANPKSRFFDGRGLILGGSHSQNYDVAGSLVGDLSAILIERISPLGAFLRVPSKKTALLSDFELKRERIALEAIHRNVTNLSGVPSWMLSVLNKVLAISSKERIDDIWPNLEVFFHGGVAFAPYKKQYQRIITLPNMHYVETYNASEGFFGVQNDLNDNSMLLLVDHDIFYEFIPFEELSLDNPKAIPLEQIKTGVNYAMVISTSCGLWRYVIGDTIRFTQKNPYKFVITGRTKSFINAFGEELIVDNAEKGIEYACAKTGAQVLEYTAAPVFMDGEAKCRHQWLIEFLVEPKDLKEFASFLDSRLQQVNSDYEAKRFKDITLQHLEIITARRGLFDDWLKSKGWLGGQHKVPRLNNNRDIIEQMLRINVPISDDSLTSKE